MSKTILDVYKPEARSLLIGRMEKGKNVTSITILDDNSHESITIRVDRQHLIGVLNAI